MLTGKKDGPAHAKDGAGGTDAGAIGPAARPGRHAAVIQKPLMTTRQILLMNFGFLGVQYSFGMQQTAVNPVFSFLHVNPDDLAILNLAGPMTGLLIQPLIGSMSDRTWSPRWGRRKPFFLIGALGCSITLFLFPFVSALWMAVLLLWLMDASNNTAMEPYRAFIADKLPTSQVARGFLIQSFFTGFGITLANVSLYVFQHFITGATSAGIPYWVSASFMLGAVCSIGSILVSVLSTPEAPPTLEELAELSTRKTGLGGALTEIGHAIKDMPPTLRGLAVVYLFQWYGMNIYWQYVSLSVGKNAFHTSDQDSAAYKDAVAWTGLVNGAYNIVTFCSAFTLIFLAKHYGAKFVHAGSLALAAGGLIVFAQLENKYLLLLPMIGLGIAWASIMGVPYIMAVASIPKDRYGVYMGIINMLIVIPMLLETVTFKLIFKGPLHSDPSLAIMFAGGLLLLAAIAMLWVKQPPGPGPATEDLADGHSPVRASGAAPAPGVPVSNGVVPVSNGVVPVSNGVVPASNGVVPASRTDDGYQGLDCCPLLSEPCRVHLLELFHAVSASEPPASRQAQAPACWLLAHRSPPA
jgi:maltose/moltooligosaccharide transporter